MDTWIERVKELLDATPTGALPLSHLLRLLKDHGVKGSDAEELVFHRVVNSPDTFKLIPDRLGAWVDWPDERASVPRTTRSTTWGPDPWIMPCQPLPPDTGSEKGVVVRMRESLRAWGQGMDDGSSVAVGQWIGANQEAGRSLGKLRVRAADES